MRNNLKLLKRKSVEGDGDGKLSDAEVIAVAQRQSAPRVAALLLLPCKRGGHVGGQWCWHQSHILSIEAYVVKELKAIRSPRFVVVVNNAHVRKVDSWVALWCNNSPWYTMLQRRLSTVSCPFSSHAISVTLPTPVRRLQSALWMQTQQWRSQPGEGRGPRPRAPSTTTLNLTHNTHDTIRLRLSLISA